MTTLETLETLARRAVTAVRDAAHRAEKYNDYGSVMGIQDEAEEILEQLRTDLHKACRLARRLICRIDKWEAGERDVAMLRRQEDDTR